MSQNPDHSSRQRKVGSDGTVFRCPQCKGIVRPDAGAFFPFCSEKCKLLDLGNWLDGRYTIGRPLDPSADDDEAAPPPSRRTPPPEEA